MQFIKLATWREAIRGLMAFLCNWIYSIMSFCYDLFNNISEVDILTSKDVQPIYNRITMIITIVMVFYVTFQFVKYVVQPDAMTDKEKGAGNLVYKIIIVIVLIAFVPKIFNLAYGVQKTVIKTNVISKVILGNQASTGDANVGSAFSASVFNMFYYVDEENISETCHDGIECGSLVNLNISNLKNDGKLNSIYLGLNETDKNDEPLITFEFDGLLAVIVGGFICYILFLYCIDVGTRWAQLLYLQLIAPIPIISYISPKKDGMFQKWVKQCTTTYIDLFLRVAIINIMLLLCDTLLKSKIAGEIAPDGSTKMMTTLMYVVLIMGVMLFAHKAPKMLAELFPKGGAASGNFGVGLKSGKERLAPTMSTLNLGKRAVGGAAGGIAGAVIGARTGRAISGMLKGAKEGGTKKGGLIGNVRKSMQGVSSDVQRDLDVKAKGGSIYGSRFFSGHYQNVSKKQDRVISDLDDMTKKKKAVSSSIENIKFRKQMDSIGTALSNSGNVTASKAWDGTKKQAEKYARQYADGKITSTEFENKMTKLISDFRIRPENNIDATMDLNLDLELGASSKWGAVKTAINDAKKTAQSIAGTTYKDMDGKEQTIKYDESKFADEIGDITDGAETASQQRKTSEEYTKAHANAQGTNSGKH